MMANETTTYVEKPKFPQYAVLATRLRSYENGWSEHVPVRTDALAKAGLVFTGVGDSVRCFFCGGGLRNWDRDDDPWLEHATWYPECVFLILRKGAEYVRRVSNGERPSDVRNRPPTVQFDPSSAAAQSCLQNGFRESDVRKAFERLRRTKGVNSETVRGADIARLILDEDLDDEIAGVPVSEADEERLSSGDKCLFCCDEPACVEHVPCGHAVSCGSCTFGYDDCPVCKRPVRGRKRN